MIVLDSQLRVPSEYMSFNALQDFRAIIRNKDGEDKIYEFYTLDQSKTTYNLPRGNTPLIEKHFGQYQIRDMRSKPSMRHDLQFTGSLRPNQQEVIDLVSTCSNGMIEAPPRFGKTVVMTALTCLNKVKTLLLCHQIDLAQQALKTFYSMTNILDLEFQHGYQIIGIVDKWEDLEKFDVCFLPYQKFVSGKNGTKMLERYRNEFGMVLIDEIHRGSAPRYSQIINAMNSYYRYGVSGTIERKDDMHIINYFVVGPVIAQGKSDQIMCQVIVRRTNVAIPYDASDRKRFWTQSLGFLAKHKDRNQMILDDIYTYANAGHGCMVLCDRTEQIDYLTRKLKEKGIAAEAYHRDIFGNNEKAREACLKRMRSGQSSVLVAYRTMTLGLDIPRLTVLFNASPTANKPNYYQEVCRVRTPYPGKNIAFIFDYLDNHYVMTACYQARKKVYEQESFQIS